MTQPSTAEQVQALERYKYGFITEIESETAPRGLDENTVRFISAKKEEPDWLLDWRLRAYRAWMGMEEPKTAAPTTGAANESTSRMASVAYAVEDSASEANTASPTFLLIV